MAAVRLISCAGKFSAPPFGHSSASERSLCLWEFSEQRRTWVI